MTVSQLANRLRKRLFRTTDIPKYVLKNTSDEEILDAYITCSDCGKRQLDDDELDFAVEEATSSKHFIDIVDTIVSGKMHDEISRN